MKEFASHVAITQANQALTVNGAGFNIANSSAITSINSNISNINTKINSINSSITNIDNRVTNIETHGSGGSIVSFDPASGILTIDGNSYSIVTQTTYDPDVVITISLDDNLALDASGYNCKIVGVDR
jgi:hypothetical protein